ncbi:prepilin peptidase [Rahnella selenatireducens]|uniref:prepilin peptidase n=1 Tax=Rahnella selenatireducens TaxID=3389797 RepID=UPI00396846A9
MLLNAVVARFILLYTSDSPSSPKIPFARPDTSYSGCAYEPELFLKLPLARQRIVRESGSPYHDQFSPRSLVIVGISTLLFSGMSFLFHNPVSWLIACLFMWFLLALSVIDYFTFILPNALTQPLLWFGLLISTLGYGVPVESAIFGAASGYLSLWFLYWCLMILIKKEGIGFGDFKLLAAIGAWSGWEALPAVCTLAALIGIFYAVMWGRFFRHDGLIPFGPALSLSGLLIYISQRSGVVWLM